MIPVVLVVGYANSGKTTLLVSLIRELKKRGLKIAVVKHSHGAHVMDAPLTDTWKHAEAGADIVALASRGQFAIREKTESELSLDEIAARISGVDIIIGEGFKGEERPKIEVIRSEIHPELITPADQLLAVAGDRTFPGITTFAPDDAAGLAEFLVTRFSLRE